MNADGEVVGDTNGSDVDVARVVIVVEPPPRTRRWWRAALVGLLLVGGGVAATIVFTGESGPSAPAEWDPRVLGLVAFVEDERGLTFEHPVAVQFLDDADYEADVRAEFDGVADDDTETLEVGAGMFRALGLAEGDLDLLEATEEVSANGELGRYLLESDRIVIRGADLDVRTSATVVHELTHALQDQVFEIGRRLDDDEDGADEGLLRAVVEGDASSVEAAWIEDLDRADRAELARLEQAVVAGDSADPFAGIPESVVAFVLSNHTVGQDFVEILLAEGGTDAVNDALADPPEVDEQILDATAYLNDDAPEHVERVELTAGETSIEDLSGEFGALALYYVLAERIDPIAALEAVNGWGGDDFAAFERDGRTCVRVRVAGEGQTEAIALERVLLAWSEAMPAEADSTVERVATTVDLETCDPGADVEIVDGEGRSFDAIRVLRTRSGILLGALRDGIALDVARCLIWSAMPSLTAADLLADEWTEATNSAFATAIEGAAGTCRD